jgi:DNA-binding transcriptional MerR regulator
MHDKQSEDLTAKELAKELGVNVDTVYTWTRRGWINPPKAKQGHNRYELRDVIASLKDRRSSTSDGRSMRAINRVLAKHEGKQICAVKGNSVCHDACSQAFETKAQEFERLAKGFLEHSNVMRLSGHVYESARLFGMFMSMETAAHKLRRDPPEDDGGSE